MRLFILGALVFCVGASSEDAIEYCADIGHQEHIDIMKLLGMWYAVEIIDHKSEHVIIEDHPEICPVLHLRTEEIPTPATQIRDDYPGRRGYAKNYGYYDTSTLSYSETLEDERRKFYQEGKFYNVEEAYRKFNEQMKFLKILWDENGDTTEYTVKYNVSKAGFWISSGPHNGSSLIPMLDHFAGDIQVLKVVHSHMVLVFCYREPDPRLFSLLLSRTATMSIPDRNSIYKLLQRKRLSTSNVKKVCISGSPRIGSSSFLAFIFLLTFLTL